jgi:hypothetical protein
MHVLIYPNEFGDYPTDSCKSIGLEYDLDRDAFQVVDEHVFFLSVIKYSVKFKIVEENSKEVYGIADLVRMRNARKRQQQERNN